MMLNLQGVTYKHPNRDILFSDLSLTLNKHDKIALVGHNGSGKSTLLNLLAGHLSFSAGVVKAELQPYLVPQIYGQYNGLSIGQALQIDAKLTALNQILKGEASEENFAILNDDWTLEERCKEAFDYWDLNALDLSQKLDSLSGGQKTKVFLAGIMIHQAELVLLDEPSNHLDLASRNLLYHYIATTHNTLLVVSHDRTLLNLLHLTYELDNGNIKVYGGNFDFYQEMKKQEHEVLFQELKNKEKTLKKAKDVARETMERQQKLDARGKKKQEKAGLPTISMNTLKNNAEKSSSKIKTIHNEKLGLMAQELTDLRALLPTSGKMKLGFDQSNAHHSKIVVKASRINFSYNTTKLWGNDISFEIKSGERLAIKGANGVGKSTLIKIVLGEVEPQRGEITRLIKKSVYVDQDYSLIDDNLTVYEQAQYYNTGELQEHDIKIRLNRFLFNKDAWNKPCSALSGGEKMRLMLCALTIGNNAPDLIVFDEPTNNLDLQNIEILTAAINDYQGTLLVIAHDEYFLKQINIEREILLM